jgi:hypothetical protein
LPLRKIRTKKSGERRIGRNMKEYSDEVYLTIHQMAAK